MAEIDKEIKVQGVKRSLPWLSAGGWMALVIILVLIADQALKIWVKTHMYIGDDIEILPWFQIKFIENNGMAFGMELGSKILLTVGRLLAVGILVWILCVVHKRQKCSLGYVIALGLVTAGAMGNIFDCVFYGKIFSNPYPPQVASLFPPDGGYAGWFEGRVVDMLYFPMFEFVWPDWIPFVGGNHFEFFQYIFNIADSAICVGFAMLLIFYSKSVNETFNIIGEKFKSKNKK